MTLKFIFIGNDCLKRILTNEQNKYILDMIPTDQKYTKEIEDVLLKQYGHGFFTGMEQQKYDIPSYITDSDILNWKIQKMVYERQSVLTYQEAYNKEVSKTFTLKA